MKYYHIERRRKGDIEPKLWFSGPEMQFVSKEYARGYLACESSYYPGYYDLRVKEAETGKIIIEQNANGGVHS